MKRRIQETQKQNPKTMIIQYKIHHNNLSNIIYIQKTPANIIDNEHLEQS